MFANSEGSNQPVQLHRLIRIFTACCKAPSESNLNENRKDSDLTVLMQSLI